jgi:hypothetical protein
MPRQTIINAVEWVSLNFLSGAYIIKDRILLNVGVGVGTINANPADLAIKYLIGVSILGFNVVRIVKYIREMRNSKK